MWAHLLLFLDILGPPRYFEFKSLGKCFLLTTTIETRPCDQQTFLLRGVDSRVAIVSRRKKTMNYSKLWKILLWEFVLLFCFYFFQALTSSFSSSPRELIKACLQLDANSPKFSAAAEFYSNPSKDLEYIKGLLDVCVLSLVSFSRDIMSNFKLHSWFFEYDNKR